MNRKLGFVAILLSAVILLVGCTAQGPGTTVFNNQPQGISVSGQGRVTATPDIAVITLGVQAQEASVADAQTKATDAMNKVISALAGNGVASKDIQTQRFSIQIITRYDDKNQRDVVIGYLVTNVVTAKIKTLDKTGAIIDAVASAGGDLTRIEGLAFSIDDPTPYNKQAREKAMSDAKAKADQMANLSGVRLGNPTFISESVNQPTSVPIKVGAPGGAPISPGDLDVIVTVQVVYSIP